MFANIFSSLKAENNNSEFSARRKYTRRTSDQCISVINGQSYPIENWSLGGLVIQGDERTFGVNDHIPITMKFKLSQKIIDIPHTARVVRKSRNKIAFEFAPLNRAIQNNFQTVIDDYVASQFAASQTQF
jgi:hypothetical protein